MGEKKTKDKKNRCMVGKKKGKWKTKEYDFAFTNFGSYSNRAWEGFRWNNIHP